MYHRAQSTRTVSGCVFSCVMCTCGPVRYVHRSIDPQNRTAQHKRASSNEHRAIGSAAIRCGHPSVRFELGHLAFEYISYAHCATIDDLYMGGYMLYIFCAGKNRNRKYYPPLTTSLPFVVRHHSSMHTTYYIY